MAPSGSAGEDIMILKVGILEVQGAFHEHKVALMNAKRQLTGVDVCVTEVRSAAHLTPDLDGLIIPGGESTTISLFLRRNEMEQQLRDWMHDPKHFVWGTCAGMILLSKYTENQKIGGQPTLGIMDTVVSRNFFGRQVHSFESPIDLHDDDLKTGDKKFHGVFIRAPAVTELKDAQVKVLATLSRAQQKDDVIVAVREGRAMSTAFHPELTEDLRWHLYFLKMIKESKRS